MPLRNFAVILVISGYRMTISVTELKARLLEIVRDVERQGTIVEVERHGQVVARIISGRAFVERVLPPVGGAARIRHSSGRA